MVKVKYNHLGKICSQKYEDLQSNGKNKFCNHCQSQVIDFTQLSDNELISYFKTHQNVCGNFEIEQIAKPISFQYKSFKSIALFIISSISTALYSKGLNTSSITKPKTEQLPFVNKSDNVLIEPLDTIKHKKKIDTNKTPLRRKFKKRRRIYLSSRFPFIFRGRRKLLGCMNF